MAGRRKVGAVAGVLAAALLTACIGQSDLTFPEVPEPRDAVDHETPTLTLDPEVVVGSLENGLTYYLRRNTSPGARVEMRLVVDTGSLLEDEATAGAAHFVEHMAFNGTEAFPGNEVIDLLTGLGAQVGPHLNAYTSYDETVYQLGLRNDDDSIATGLRVLEQWAGSMQLDPEDVEAERGVVIEEWRTTTGADARAHDALQDLVLAGTSAEDHDPIGRLEALQAISAAELRDFYRQHYRPEELAVVIVGDIDVDDVEAKVRDRFRTLPASSEPDIDPDPVSPWNDTRAASFADASLSSSWVTVHLPVVPAQPEDFESWRLSWQRHAATDIVRQRLSDDIAGGEQELLSAESGRYEPVRSLDTYWINVEATPERLDAAAAAVITEIERLRRHGVTDQEVRRLADEYRQRVETRFAGIDSIQDRELANALVEHHLEGVALPAEHDRRDADLRIIDEMGTEFVEEGVLELYRGGLAIVAAGEVPELVPTETQLLELVSTIESAEIAPRAEVAFAAEGILPAPEPVAPIEKRILEFEGAELRRYANGVSVVILPTDIHDGHVTLQAMSFGGYGPLRPDQLAPAMVLGEVLSHSGAGELDAVALDRFLADREVHLDVAVDPTAEHLFGFAASDDLDVLLQLTRATMTRPRISDVAVRRTVDRLLPLARNPDRIFREAPFIAYDELRHGGDPKHASLPSADALSAMTAADVSAVATDRLGDASGWAFALVGDVPGASAGTLADTYLGTLPGSGDAEPWVETGTPFPGSRLTRAIEVPGEQASFTIGFGTSIVGDLRDEILGEFARLVVLERLRVVVREELGGSYGPEVYTQLTYEPRQEFELLVHIEVEPERLSEIHLATRNELTQLTLWGPDEAVLRSVRTQLSNQYELWDNAMLAGRLVESVLRPGRDAAEIYDRTLEVRAISDDEVAAFVSAVLGGPGSIAVTVTPPD